ncbi:SprT-like domain-containing protein Spartan [Taenia solium]|eukprot:TsM_001180900 transcript=TsM_001180900 gene=TsM_001180900
MSGEHSREQSAEKLGSNYPVYHPLNNPTPAKVPRKRRTNKEECLSAPNIEISPVDPIWQTIDPTPDVRSLFATFDAQFFGGRLSSVEVRWSPRMTLCAGQCVYEGLGGLCSIRLSEPLLKYRPRSDLVETLLVYHSFHDEVENYKVHWWRCDGPCANRPPFYGLVRRSMNRAPGPNDIWWSEHQATCSGQFMKILEPEAPKNTAKKGKRGLGKSKSQLKTSDSILDYLTRSVTDSVKGRWCSNRHTGDFIVYESAVRPIPADLRQFFQSTSRPEDVPSNSSTASKTTLFNEPVVPFSGVGHRLGGSLSPPAQPRLLALTAPPPPSLFATASANGSNAGSSFAAASAVSSSDFTPTGAVQCPVCFQSVPADFVNEHLDACLVAA